MAEQRFNAVMEVLRDGLTVIEVADRYGVSRQTVHGWLRWASSGWRPPRSCPGLRHQPRPTRPGHDPEGLRTS